MREKMESMDRHIEQVVLELGGLRKAIEDFPRGEMEKVVEMARIISKAILDGKMVFSCGNGGSAADAQHIAGELVGRFRRKKVKGFKAVALTVNSSVVTALANDFSYDEVFSKQLESMGSDGDILLVLSTSGNSENGVRAVDMAGKLGMTSFAFTGPDGGRLEGKADITLKVPHDDFARIQEMHMTLGHILCGLVEEMVVSGS